MTKVSTLPNQLLIIDPQNDFIDTPEKALPKGFTRKADGSYLEELWQPQLAVPGSYEDSLRLAEFIRRCSKGIDDITVTLDSHHVIGIERTTFWMNADGSPIAPFTQILLVDVTSGKYLPRNPALMDVVINYLTALEQLGRYKLMVWPVHCVVGTWGHNIQADIADAIRQWEVKNFSLSQKLTKGSNPFTEHYGAFHAEVPDPNDATTQVNFDQINMFANSRVFIAGQAASHCVRESIFQLTTYIGDEHLKNLVLLTDAMSPVPGFEAQAQDFFDAMRAKGVQLAKCDDVAPELILSR